MGNIHMRIAILITSVLLTLVGCESPTTQRYAVSADNNQSIKQTNATGIGLATFAGPANFSSNCRALGPMRVADGITHTQYIQRAFEDELKIAGAFSASPARVTLTGKIEKIDFSTTRAVTGGSWTIDFSLGSSNGKNLKVSEYYEFDSGFMANEACRNTAEAFSRAVQNLVGKTVKHPSFASLVQ
jgi:hypothetical protein